VRFSGRFGRSGKKVRGRVRMSSPRCGGSGNVPWSATYTKTPVRLPKPGEYAGKTRQAQDLVLYVSGSFIQLADIGFRCGAATGRTSVNAIELRRTLKGYAFSLRANGSVTYSDGRPDENAEVDISGRFAKGGRRASGRLRVKSPRCGGTGQVRWGVERRAR
jgi:hypothetical protein